MYYVYVNYHIGVNALLRGTSGVMIRDGHSLLMEPSYFYTQHNIVWYF